MATGSVYRKKNCTTTWIAHFVGDREMTATMVKDKKTGAMKSVFRCPQATKTFSKGTSKENERSARRWLRDHLHDVEHLENSGPSQILVGEMLDRYKVSIKNWKPTTVRLYTTAIEKHIRPALGRYRMQALLPMHIEPFYQSFEEHPATGRVVHAVLSAVYQKARQNRIVSTNCARDAVKALPKLNPSPQRSLSITELDAIWDYARRHGTLQEVAALRLLFCTGMRVSEFCGLKWCDLDVQNGTISIRRQLSVPARTKGGELVKARYVDYLKRGFLRTNRLGRETLDALLAHRGAQHKLAFREAKWYRRDAYLKDISDEPIFSKDVSDVATSTATLGLPWSRLTVASMLKRISKAANVRPLKGPHGARHTHISLRIAAHENPANVARDVGDKVATILKFYVHAIADEQETADPFETLRRKSRKEKNLVRAYMNA